MSSKIKKLFISVIVIFSFSIILSACGDTGGGGAPKAGGATKESREEALRKLGTLQDENQKDDSKKK